MTLLHLALFAGLLLLSGAPSGATQDPGKKPPAAAEQKKIDAAELQKLAWISGTWVLEEGGKTTEEHWRPLQGTTLLGSSHTYDGAKTHFFEHLRIAAMRGTIAYIAMPGGKAPTVFLATRLEEGLVEFEKPDHDHPQRIRYQKTEAGLTATISQLDGSRAQSFVFKQK
ncbi:MAG TPA: DUF6265 family protein [Planctomycetota bacterium]